MSGVFYRFTSGGLELLIRLQPGASRQAIGGIREGADGRSYLEVRVSAPPVEGKANAALIRFLAKTLGLRKSAITLCAGASSREKTLVLEADAPDRAKELVRRLEALLSP